MSGGALQSEGSNKLQQPWVEDIGTSSQSHLQSHCSWPQDLQHQGLGATGVGLDGNVWRVLHVHGTQQ